MDRVDYRTLIIQDLKNRHASQELDLNPWYQRREVWKNPQKAYLINTFFVKKPVPTIYFRHSIDVDKGKSLMEVVDGQQRCKAVLSYLNDEFAARHPNYPRAVKYSSLTSAEKKAFVQTPLAIGELLGASDEDVVDIFARINSVAKTLNDQEKRNASYSGDFKQFCLSEAGKRLAFWRNYGVFSANDIARMGEIQFISEVAICLVDGLKDQSQSNINSYYEKWDEDFPSDKVVSKKLTAIFRLLAAADKSSIADTIFSRQPLLFSLILAMSVKMPSSAKALADTLWEIDGKFQTAATDGGNKADRDFYAASSTSTQRIKQRQIRHQYIVSKLS